MFQARFQGYEVGQRSRGMHRSQLTGCCVSCPSARGSCLNKRCEGAGRAARPVKVAGVAEGGAAPTPGPHINRHCTVLGDGSFWPLTCSPSNSLHTV